MTLPYRPSAVIFDMDGLLFDTEALWQEALLSAAAEGGHEVADDLFSKLIGVPRSQCRALFLSHFGVDFLFGDFHANWVRHFWLIAANKLALKPGALELLEILDQFRLPRAIATSSSRTTVERHLTSHSLMDRFDEIICRGDYEKGKPAPDPFLKAAERLGVEPRLCLALEDSHIGVRSAAAAGMMTVMVPDLLEPTDDIFALRILVVRDLLEVRDLILTCTRVAASGRSRVPLSQVKLHLIGLGVNRISMVPWMQRSSRVDYDAIAELYDSTPHRQKSVDPELAAFLGERKPTASLTLLDIACGTGNQQIANRDIAPNASLVGLDGSLGMLRQAQRKMPDLAWVHGDSAALPFASSSFDFVSCQYAFHHFRDKLGMLREAFRALRHGGRFSLYNMCPQEAEDWLYYAYFPEAKARDFADFWPPATIASEMAAGGFVGIGVERRHLRFEHDLAELLAAVQHRERNSQLLSLSAVAYEAGLRRIERDLDNPQTPQIRADHLCFVTVRGDRP